METKTSVKEKFSFLLGFIEELFKERPALLISDWHKNIEKDILDAEVYAQSYICFDKTGKDIIFRITKPNNIEPPFPREELRPFLTSYNDINQKPTLIPDLPENQSSSLKLTLEDYLEDWDKWRKERIITTATINLFNDFYEQYTTINNSNDTKEMVLGRIVLKGRSQRNEEVDYPILFRNVDLFLDADTNSIYIKDSGEEDHRYDGLLNKLELSDPNYINDKLSVECFEEGIFDKYSKALVAQDIYDKGFQIYDEYIVFVKDKNLNLGHSIELIKKEIALSKEDSCIPSSIKRILKEKEIVEDNQYQTPPSYEEILFIKDSNEEQRKIARAIRNKDVVLVKGPPGTGKTHTIVNLIGNLLSEGKTVLVSSHTEKALSVIREKLPIDLKNLCLPLLSTSENKSKSGRENALQTAVSSIRECFDRYGGDNFESINAEIEQITKERNSLLYWIEKNKEIIKQYKLKEFNNSVLAIDGESFSFSKMAKFVSQNQAIKNIIPQPIMAYERWVPLPITREELVWIYQSNEIISKQEEEAIRSSLPDFLSIMHPDVIKILWEDLYRKEKEMQEIRAELYKYNNYKTNIKSYGLDNLIYLALNPDKIVSFVKENHITRENIEKILGALEVCRDYKNNWKDVDYKIIFDAFVPDRRTLWQVLIKLLRDYAAYDSKTYSLRLGRNIKIDLNNDKYEYYANSLEKVKNRNTKVIGFLNRKIFKRILLSKITIDGKILYKVEDIDAVVSFLRLQSKEQNTKDLFNRLLPTAGNIFGESEVTSRANVVSELAGRVENILNVPEHNIFPLLKALNTFAGVNIERTVFEKASSKEDIISLLEIIICMQRLVWKYYLLICFKIPEINKKIAENKSLFNRKNIVSCEACRMIIDAMDTRNLDSYTKYYKNLEDLYQKQANLDKRKNILNKIEPVAPEWALAIERRQGIHGLNIPPKDPDKAWRVAVFDHILEGYNKYDIEKLQEDVDSASKRLKETTTDLIVAKTKKGLVSNIKKDDSVLRHIANLEAIVKKIGSGHRKDNASLERSKVQSMEEIRRVIPVLITTINSAIGSLLPNGRKFDVAIIDEASQADLKAIIVMYMAKKIIIVGDEQQITPNVPMFSNTDYLQNLRNKYHIKAIFPENVYSIDQQFSIYDMANMGFSSPMWLTEHFRCVEPIISFSNSLSYDNRIQILRDSSNTSIKPSLVDWFVKGVKDGDINKTEAEAISSLIAACIKLPEYENATFGVISMRANGQDSYIQNLINEKISLDKIAHHKILCGTSAMFQGDERDVIFLSLVDIPNEDGSKMRLLTAEGKNNEEKKKYNVAVSRAKDQLWVVHSMSKDDLQPLDIRRALLDHVNNYNSKDKAQIEEKAQSPFELEVGKEIVEKGYNIFPQYKVGSYRIDFVITCGEKRIALECDGEAFHSSPEQIEEDYIREDSLRRCGWNFLRLRGSKYYYNKPQAINWLCEELGKNGIYPNDKTKIEEEEKLLNSIKQTLNFSE